MFDLSPFSGARFGGLGFRSVGVVSGLYWVMSGLLLLEREWGCDNGDSKRHGVRSFSCRASDQW